MSSKIPSDLCLLDNNDARGLFSFHLAQISAIISCNHLTFKSTFNLQYLFFSHHILRHIPNPSFLLYTKLGLQFNFPSVPSLKYDPRNEIRAPEYRVWSTTGSGMETWPDSEVKRHALVGEGRPDPAPQVVWLNICPAPLGCLDTSTQPPSYHPSVLLRCDEGWRGQLGRVPKSFSTVPEVAGVQQPGESGLCIFKTLGPTFGESRIFQTKHRLEK